MSQPKWTVEVIEPRSEARTFTVTQPDEVYRSQVVSAIEAEAMRVPINRMSTIRLTAPGGHSIVVRHALTFLPKPTKGPDLRIVSPDPEQPA